MGDVVDLGAHRAARRRGRHPKNCQCLMHKQIRERQAESEAEHPSSWESPTDLRALQDAINRQISDLTLLDLHPFPSPVRRGYEPTYVFVDEVQHWMDNNTAFEKLRRGYLNHLAGRGDPAPERRSGGDRVLRILRSTDQGSNGGDAESHQGDDRTPRR